MKTTFLLFCFLFLASCQPGGSSGSGSVSDVSTSFQRGGIPGKPSKEPGNNSPPIVKAGADIVVTDEDKNGSETITLQGFATDEEKNITTCQLYKNGALVIASGDDSIFRSQLLLPVGSYTFIMAATDSKGLMSTDTMTVVVNPGTAVNNPPVVKAGADFSVTDADNNGSEMVKLAGSASDVENNITKYVVARDGVAILNSTDSSILTASISLSVGTHTIAMTATDSGGLQVSDSVVITVKAPVVTNTAPVISAVSKSLSAVAGSTNMGTVTLTATATDSQNNISSYNVKEGTTILKSGATTGAISAALSLAVGSHSLVLEVIDAGGLKASASIAVTISAPVATNTAPVISSVSNNLSAVAGSTGTGSVTLSAMASDAQNNISSYNIKEGGVVLKSGSTTGAISAALSLAVGSHSLLLEVIDAGALKASATISATITAPVVQSGSGPKANAGPDVVHQNDDHDGDAGESSGVEKILITTSALAGSNALASWAIKVNEVTYATGKTFPIPAQYFYFIKGTNDLALEVTDSAGMKSIDHAVVLVKPGLDDIPYGSGPEIKPGILSVSAGGQRILIDRDMDGKESVVMTGAVNSINPIVNYQWVWHGQVLAQSSSPGVLTSNLNFPLGVNRVSLKVTDSLGNTATDGIEVTVSAAFQEQLPSIPTDPTLVTNNLVNVGMSATNHWKDQSAFRFRCEASHVAYDDPIVFPGQPGKAHLHMFYGNSLTNGNSTYQSLRTTGGGTCDGGPLNRTAYWMPAVLNENNKVVVPDMVTIYYKKYPGTLRIPRGLKMIFGYDHKNPTVVNAWKCSDGDTSTHNTFAGVTNCPATTTSGKYKLMAALGALECWDGKNLDSPDHRSHMASCVRDNNWGNCSCPATHPVSIPHFTLLVSWTHNGYAEYSKWRLSSDHVLPHDSTSAALPGGTSFHGDWFGAWDDDVMDMWINGCIGQFKNCSAGDTGTGKMLKEQPGFTFGIDPTKRLIDPPVSPSGAVP